MLTINTMMQSNAKAHLHHHVTKPSTATITTHQDTADVIVFVQCKDKVDYTVWSNEHLND